MENRLPQKRNTLFSQALGMAAGCHKQEASLELAHNNEANVRADLQAATAANNLFQAARTAKADAIKAQRSADKNARAFIVIARDVLKPHLGTSWSQRWSGTGFNYNSLAVPKALAERRALVESLKAYFTAHPQYEVSQTGVTAGAAAEHYKALTDARGDVNARRADLGTKKTASKTATKKLRKRLRGLIAELKQVLPPDDGRWIAFGLNRPAAQPVPAAPLELKVETGGPSHLLATWKAPPYAKRFRIYKQVIGVDADFVSAATVTDTSVNLNTFTPGTIVRLCVTAVNDVGESVPCEAVEQMVS